MNALTPSLGMMMISEWFCPVPVDDEKWKVTKSQDPSSVERSQGMGSKVFVSAILEGTGCADMRLFGVFGQCTERRRL